ncbi:cytochrome P450 [Amycolatopsis jiangsuensis]|uniref:Cytochrome P450 n=1 Tax=Amycolatopsis jiangsuensis TaxID=1181879 RepID=A0A840IWE5_9PSEU|nr:cytochrome P450 [Amycolatopsis jiangsuensis]MBB4685478.1 cytochrome P450 [Amycolatopsis jiangsuensis]
MSSSVLPLPNEAVCPFGPNPELSALRETTPLPRVSCPTGIEAWLVSRYADVREVLGAPQRFSSRGGSAGHLLAHTPPDSPIEEGEFARMDGADHVRFRHLFAPAVSTAKRMAEIRPMVQRIVDEALDALAERDHPVDLHEEFAKPVTTAVIGELLGVPAADRGLFHRAAEALFSGETDVDEFGAAKTPLYDYVQDLVTQRRAEPGEDAISILATRGTDFSDFELVRMAAGLLVAGYDTTASLITHATLALLEDPGQLALLRDEPDVLPGAVEEVVRLLGVGAGLLRVAVTDTEIAGTPIAAGDYVVVAVQGANHDPAQFAEPGRLDLRRDNRRHLGFGFGPHQCVGQQLARLELNVVLGTLPRRIPSLRLAVPITDLRFKTDTPITGPAHLPVTWDEIRPA